MSNFSSYADLLLEEIESKEEGSFLIKNLEGFAILTVYPGGREGKPIALEEVMNRIHLFGIVKIDIKKIEDIIHNADGNEHRIGEWSGGIPIDAKLDLEVSEDKMEAYVLIHPPKNGGRMIGISDVYTLLETNSVKFGMMDKAIEEMVQKSKYLIKILVAKGKAPISSTRGYIKIYFDSSNKPELLQDERGKIDYKNIHIIRSVKTGQLLAQKVPPHSGENGKDIYGNDILFEIADDGHWKIGENCELSSDETRLYSKISGRPVQDRDGTIRVDEIVVLQNVDYSTGNIDFPGTIIVEGTVADDFTLKTRGSIIIKNSVGRVFLYAEKDIVLSGGVMGKNGGRIEAGNDIYAKFVEQGNLKAGKGIIIEEASMHSELIARDFITVMGGRGELIGGDAIAGNYICVSKLGAVVETRTNIVVGLPPVILDELKKMREEVYAKEETLFKVRQTIQKTNESYAQKKELSFEEREILKKLIEVEKKYTNLLSNLRSQYDAILANYDSSEAAYIQVEKFIFPRVSINFGKGKIYNSELRTINGKCYVYINSENLPHDTHIPPRSRKSIPEKT
jgi:uncharacterized protein (DUF342 family)